MDTVILTLSAVLALAFLATRLASWLRVPHSVFLVLLGILGGLGLHAAHRSLPAVIESHYPEIVLFLLLPPLVFESAYQMDSRQLFRDWLPTGALAVFGMLLNCLLVGLGLHVLLRIPLQPALLFGALISATDPVAVVALFKEVGAPNRLATLVEGESLLNDGTALVLYRVLLGAALGGHLDPVSSLVQFLFVCLGGLIVGALFIVLSRAVLRITHSGTAQVGLTVAVAYASFIVAEWTHVSGVLSTLTVGLYLGRRARLELNREALHSMQNLWEFVALATNSLVFLAVGLTVDLTLLWQSVETVPLVLLIVYVARTVAVVFTLGPLARLGWGNPVSAAYQAVIVWAGLRGGLALALVLLLPPNLAYKPLFLAYATAVVLCSLIINALTTGMLLRKLGLDRLSPREYGLYLRSLQQTFGAVFSNYRQAADAGTLSTHLVQILQECAERVAKAEVTGEVDEGYEAQKLLLFEQKHYDEQLELGILSARAYHRLSRSVRERLRWMDENGPESLQDFPFEFEVEERAWLFAEPELEKLALQLEILLHVNLWLKEPAASAPLQRRWAEVAQARLAEFYRHVPHLGMAVQHRFLSRAIVSSAWHSMEELREAGMISGAVLSRARQELGRFLAEQDRESVRLFRPTTGDLLRHAPLFAGLPPTALEKIETSSRYHKVAPNTAVITEGTPGDSCFLVLRGMLSVSATTRVDCNRLFAGSLFGEISLLANIPRTATVTTEVECELLEIGGEVFLQLIEEHPDFRHEVNEQVRERNSQRQGPARP